MDYETRDLEKLARQHRAMMIGEWIGSALAWMTQVVSKAWRSSTAKGTNSKALS